VCVLRLPQERARLFAECHGCVDACDGRRTVPQETLKPVHVVGAPPASPRVLTVDGIDAQTTGSVAEDQRVLKMMDVGEVSGLKRHARTFDLTDPEYSVLRCTVKCRTVFLCSCFKRP